MLKASRFWVLAFLILLLPACAGHGVKPESTKGVYHVVKKGETLWSISRAYHASLQELAEVNNITNAASIEAGDVIFIPGAEQVIDIPVAEPKIVAKKQTVQKEPPKKTAAQRDSARKKLKKVSKSPQPSPLPQKAKPEKKVEVAASSAPSAAEEKPDGKKPAAPQPAEAGQHESAPQRQEKAPEHDKIEFDRKRFVWPVKGAILSRYGIQPNGLKNNGIKIGAQDGTPIVAAASGEVTYSDTLKYYGETIIVRHDENFSTVYTMLKSRGVKTGDRVKKGEKIAAVGKSDGNGQSCFSFEIRQLNKPRNPLFFLP